MPIGRDRKDGHPTSVRCRCVPRFRASQVPRSPQASAGSVDCPPMAYVRPGCAQAGALTVGRGRKPNHRKTAGMDLANGSVLLVSQFKTVQALTPRMLAAWFWVRPRMRRRLLMRPEGTWAFGIRLWSRALKVKTNQWQKGNRPCVSIDVTNWNRYGRKAAYHPRPSNEFVPPMSRIAPVIAQRRLRALPLGEGSRPGFSTYIRCTAVVGSRSSRITSRRSLGGSRRPKASVRGKWHD
jgi:hypothetical protein